MVDLFCNAALLSNLRVDGRTLKIRCNEGKMTTNMVGDLNRYGTVWYHKKGIANIISTYRVTTNFHVQFDSRSDNQFIVWREDEAVRVFQPGPNEVYFCDVTEVDGILLANDGIIYNPQLDNDPADINTVDNNMKNFTQRAIRDAATCRAFQNTAVLTTNGLIAVVDKKMLNNSPVTRQSIKIALSIWGPSIPNLDGKTRRTRGNPVVLNKQIISTLPPHILQQHPLLILSMDVVKINGMPFLSTISRIIKLGSCTRLLNTMIETIVPALLVITDTYTSRGFSIMEVAVDYAFEAMRTNQGFMKMSITLNTTSEDEHELFIEAFTKFLKERCRICHSALPFLRIPRRMTVELVYLQVY